MSSYKRLLHRADQHFFEVATAMAAQLQCRAGCTMCCHGLFEISAADVAVVIDGVAALDRADAIRLIAQARSVIEQTRHPDLRDCSPEEKELFFARADATACPALDPAGRCSIYAARPLVCRTFGLPLRDGDDYRGEECELNFTSATRKEKEAAAWDLQWEDMLGPEDEFTVPEAILLAAAVLGIE